MGERLHYVAPVEDIGEGERIIIEVDEVEYSVFNIDGSLEAVANYCVHQGGPVCEGMLAGTLKELQNGELTYSQEDQIVSCPWHGWEFDIKTGEHLARPQFKLLKRPVVVQDGEVYISN